MFERLGDYTEHNHYENTRQREFFQRFLDFLSLYCKKERSVQFYADRLKITPKYLSNLTNMYTGFSASIVIDQYVAYSIKRMLYSNEHNIKKVSDMYHFPSQSFFGRYFKRIVGVSPNAYIKEHNKKATIEE
jgi:AraC-like DNA-binding protein